MKNKKHFLSALLHFSHNEQGSVAVIFALILIPLVLTIGLGADFGEATNYKHQLQSAADAASLAGASAFTSTSGTSVPIGVANNYMAKYIAQQQSGVSITYSSSASTVTSNSTVQGYTVTVTATMQMQNNFMKISSLTGGSSQNAGTTTISVSSTAENPVLTANFNTGGFSSGACDNNALYWYIVPNGGGVPPASAMNLLWDNQSTNPPSATSFTLLGSQQIGFALKNVTDARYSCSGYPAQDMYGQLPGDTQWFYSSMQPPSAAYNVAPGGNNTGTHGVYPTDQDCSLVVEKGTTNGGVTSYPGAPQGTCFTASGTGENTNINEDTGNADGFCYGCGSGETMAQAMGVVNGQSAAAPSCSSLNGNSYQYDWNDMGWNIDSLNYGNDMIYTFSCAGTHSGGTSSGVYLVQ